MTHPGQQRALLHPARPLQLSYEASALTQAVVYFDAGADRLARLLEAHATLRDPWTASHAHALTVGQMSVNAVGKDPNGIGYGGAACAKGVRLCAIRRQAGSPGVLPGEATVKDGSYTLARPLFSYLRKRPEGAAKQFVDWVLSPEGQRIVTQVGYYPVR